MSLPSQPVGVAHVANVGFSCQGGTSDWSLRRYVLTSSLVDSILLHIW